jgi:ankyrin repeat protein
MNKEFIELVKRGNLEEIKNFLSTQTDKRRYIFARETHSGNTVLMITNNIEIAKFLIENGADVNAKNMLGKTPLIIALEKNYSEDYIEMLINNDANVKYVVVPVSNYAIGTSDGYTTLMFSKNIIISRILLNRGADINITSKSGETALTIAIKDRECTDEYIKFLINNGADINMVNVPKYKRPLYLAAYDRRIDIVEFLIFNDNFIVDDDTDYTYNTLFIIISKFLGHKNTEEICYKIAKFLLEIKKVTNSLSITLIIIVNSRSISLDYQINMIKLLVNYGADIYFKAYGESAIIIAERLGRDDIVNLLLEPVITTSLHSMTNPHNKPIEDAPFLSNLNYVNYDILPDIYSYLLPDKSTKDGIKRKSIRKSKRKSIRKSKRKSSRKSKRKSIRKSKRKSMRKSKRKSTLKYNM